MNKIANRKVICDVLMEHAAQDEDITVLCSDSRGSASLSAFADRFPEQFVEAGIAEQDLVGIAAGMAHSGKKPFVASPASFLSARSYEQIKVDVAYSNMNVKLIGISGGVSYGALGMSHHSLQDIAAIAALPNMRVYLPSDRHQTKVLTEALLKDKQSAYIRIGRNPVEDIYSEDHMPFEMDRATKIGTGKDVLLVACGEMVKPAVDAMELLERNGIHASVLDMYCLKPLDRTTLLEEAADAKLVITVEEHAPSGGLGSMVCQTLSADNPKKIIVLSLPDEPVVTGNSAEVFDHYALNAAGIAAAVKANMA
ncbi:transketolase family protein [Lactonifactor longoviformis]|uniref:transketolase family protein n=1 Tax=Lactonifactor longoviformis TaxID=341220 RepID=UPI00210DADF2|nr:transketolase C-terminal domain-containing protein [Lactonifactor longoviformis]MCQ4673318.1 transketolase family protein [Lactonifactor longoviformis]